MTERCVGSPIQRLEDERYLVGRGLFIDDIKLPGMVCAHFLRSPHPHARIQKIDYEQARELVYGMPYEDWKARYQQEASSEQLETFDKQR